MLLSHIGSVMRFEHLVILGCDTVSSGEKFPMFRRIMVPSSSGSSSLTLEDGTDRLAGNVCNELPIYAA